MAHIIGQRELSWMDVLGTGPFKLTKLSDPYGVVLHVEARVVGGNYKVDRFFGERPAALREVIEEMTDKAKQVIIDDYGLAGHIEKQLAEEQTDLLGRLSQAIVGGQLRDTFEVLRWIHDERAKRR